MESGTVLSGTWYANGAIFDLNCNRFWHKQEKEGVWKYYYELLKSGAISGVFQILGLFWIIFQNENPNTLFYLLFFYQQEDTSQHFGGKIIVQSGNTSWRSGEPFFWNDSPPLNAPRSWNPMNISKTLVRITFETAFRVFSNGTKVRYTVGFNNNIFLSLWNFNRKNILYS